MPAVDLRGHVTLGPRLPLPSHPGARLILGQQLVSAASYTRGKQNLDIVVRLMRISVLHHALCTSYNGLNGQISMPSKRYMVQLIMVKLMAECQYTEDKTNSANVQLIFIFPIYLHLSVWILKAFVILNCLSTRQYIAKRTMYCQEED